MFSYHEYNRIFHKQIIHLRYTYIMSTCKITLTFLPLIALLIYLALFPSYSNATGAKSATVSVVNPKDGGFSKTSKCNVFWTAFLPGNCAVYEFDGKHFEEKRVEQLKDIVRNGGSVQSNDALEYGEYLAMKLKKGPFEPELIVAYQAQVDLLNQNIVTFLKDHGVPLRQRGDVNVIPTVAELRKGVLREARKLRRKGIEDGNRKSMKLVMECKLFMAKLMSEGAPGAWLDLQKFMDVRNNNKKYVELNAGNNDKDNKYAVLRRIYECSTVQHKKLDEMINQAIVDEHLLNRPKFHEGKPKFNRVIIEGGGPVGLFAAFRFYMAGANVLIVNDRLNYTRNRAIFFDQRWMQQLRFLLGTQFDNLFVDKMSPGHINMPENVGQTNIKEMEERLMKRLKSLEQFLNLNKKFGPKQTSLHLRYGVKFEGVENSEKSETGQIGVMTVPKGELKEQVEEEIDFLVCAGGANDRIRDKYIGKTAAQSVTKYYGVIIFIKKDFGKEIFKQRTIFYEAKLSEIVEHLRAYQIDQLIEENAKILPSEFHQKYKNLTEKIAAEGDAQLIIRLFETKGTVHIASITPTVADLYFKELDQIQKDANSTGAKDQILKKFCAKIEKKWGSALYRVAMARSHPEKIQAIDAKLRGSNLPDNRVKFDPYPVNATNFPLTINAVKDAVGVIVEGVKQDKEDLNEKTDGPKTIAIAVGDGNTSPHFMTSSGVSTGRMGVERAAKLLRDYHNGDVKNAVDFVKELGAALNSIKKRVVAKVKQEVGHLKWLPEAEVDYSFGPGGKPSGSGDESRTSG